MPQVRGEHIRQETRFTNSLRSGQYRDSVQLGAGFNRSLDYPSEQVQAEPGGFIGLCAPEHVRHNRIQAAGFVPFQKVQVFPQGINSELRLTAQRVQGLIVLLLGPLQGYVIGVFARSEKQIPLMDFIPYPSVQFRRSGVPSGGVFRDSQVQARVTIHIKLQASRTQVKAGLDLQQV